MCFDDPNNFNFDDDTNDGNNNLSFGNGENDSLLDSNSSFSYTDDDLTNLNTRADNFNDFNSFEEEDNSSNKIIFGRKVCPTRHGCSGATDCDCCYADYPY